MGTPIRIDFISDISCGWCAVALKALEQALANIGPDISAELHFQPFELNPDLPSGGKGLNDYLRDKYGERAGLQYLNGTRTLGAELGFEFNLNDASRIYNTFDAHRLLHWAGPNGRQSALKHALFEAHFGNNRDPGDHEVLLECARVAGLDVEEAGQILTSNAHAIEVREMEATAYRKGVSAVPTIIINDEYLAQGMRSVETFEQMLRSAMASATKAAASKVPSAPGGDA